MYLMRDWKSAKAFLESSSKSTLFEGLISTLFGGRRSRSTSTNKRRSLSLSLLLDRQDFYEIQNSISQISLEFQSRRKPISIQREISSSTYLFHLLRNIQISRYPNIHISKYPAAPYSSIFCEISKYPNIQQLLKYPAATNSSIF